MSRGLPSKPSIQDPVRRQAQFNPVRYLHAHARAIEEKGGRILNKTQADGFKDGAPWTADVNGVTSSFYPFG